MRQPHHHAGSAGGRRRPRNTGSPGASRGSRQIPPEGLGEHSAAHPWISACDLSDCSPSKLQDDKLNAVYQQQAEINTSAMAFGPSTQLPEHCITNQEEDLLILIDK